MEVIAMHRSRVILSNTKDRVENLPYLLHEIIRL